MQMWKQQREAILKSLQNCRLHIFCYYSRDRDEILDLDRDNFLSAQEAMEYGLIDKVIERAPRLSALTGTSTGSLSGGIS